MKEKQRGLYRHTLCKRARYCVLLGILFWAVTCTVLGPGLLPTFVPDISGAHIGLEGNVQGRDLPGRDVEGSAVPSSSGLDPNDRFHRLHGTRIGAAGHSSYSAGAEYERKATQNTGKDESVADLGLSAGSSHQGVQGHGSIMERVGSAQGERLKGRVGSAHGDSSIGRGDGLSVYKPGIEYSVLENAGDAEGSGEAEGLDQAAVAVDDGKWSQAGAGGPEEGGWGLELDQGANVGAEEGVNWGDAEGEGSDGQPSAGADTMLDDDDDEGDGRDDSNHDGDVGDTDDGGEDSDGEGAGKEGGEAMLGADGSLREHQEQGQVAGSLVTAAGISAASPVGAYQASREGDATALGMDKRMQAVAQRMCGSELKFDRENLFVTAANQKRVRPKDMVRLPHFLPQEPLPLSFATCALVANSGILKSSRFGATIDRHDVVLRVNQAPTQGYERCVGSRTTFRLLNKKWAAMYTSKTDGRGLLLPSEDANATLVLTRVKAVVFQHLASVVRRQRPDIKVLLLAPGVETRARLMLEAYRKAMDELGFSYQGGGAPSSGFLGLFLLLQMCRHVSVYGLSLESSSSRRLSLHPYHYFTHYVDSVRLRAHPHHSFLMEGDMALGLAGARCITLCMPRMDPSQYELHMRWALTFVAGGGKAPSGCGA